MSFSVMHTYNIIMGRMLMRCLKITFFMQILKFCFTYILITHLCLFSKSLTASTLLHRLVLSIELGTVQTGTGKVTRLGNSNVLRLPVGCIDMLGLKRVAKSQFLWVQNWRFLKHWFYSYTGLGSLRAQ